MPSASLPKPVSKSFDVSLGLKLTG